YRHRLPEEHGAVAAFSVERIERIEDADDHRDQHRESTAHVIGGGEHAMGVRRMKRLDLRGHVEDESDQEQRRRAGAGKVKSAVFRELPAQAPLILRERGNSLCFGARDDSIHRAAPCACPAWLPITATKRSAIFGVRTSPSEASCARSRPSNSSTLRPNDCR